jgi:hypothetical protein
MRNIKTGQSFVVVTAVLFSMAGCDSFISFAVRSSLDWNAIQAAGGILIEPPLRLNGHVRLPIRCDVSGCHTITVRPTSVSSFPVCERPRVRVRERKVFITVRRGIANPRNHNPWCPDADLGAIPAGDYSVIYLSPDGSQRPLSEIHVP